MTYIELFQMLKHTFESKKIEALEWISENNFEHQELEIMLLAFAMTDRDTICRNTAKKLVKKIGNPVSVEILKNLSRRRYDQKKAKEHFQSDLEYFNQLNNFDLTLFSKYVSLFNRSVASATDYFLKNASTEQLEFFFVNNCYRYLETSMLYFHTNNKTEGRLVQELWKSTFQNPDKIGLISFSTNDKVSLNQVADMPNIYELKFKCLLDNFPKDIFKLKSLQTLSINCNLSQIPDGIEKLSNLKYLSISAPITTLPDGIYNLEKLKELDIQETNITGLSTKIANLKNLTFLNLRESNRNLRVIPEEIFDLPNLHKSLKEEIQSNFVSKNPYARIYHKFKFCISWFKDIPLVAQLISDFEAGKVDKFPELLIATSRCYYDDEHGLKLVNLPRDLRDECKNTNILDVNKAIKKKFIDEKVSDQSLEEIRLSLKKFEWFDQDFFIDLVKLMVKHVDNIYPHEKW